MNIKNYLILGFSFSLLFIISCKDDEMSGPTYVGHEVAFYLDHPNVIIEPTEFEVNSNQRQSKEESKEGATFETVTEQVLVKEESFEYTFANEQNFDIVTNTETGSSQNITCRSFINAEDIIATPIPAQYSTLTKQKVLVDGIGNVVPAEYTTYETQVVVKDAELIMQTNTSRNTEIITFRLESGVSVNEHIEDELANKSISGCLNGDSYLIQ